MICTDFQADLIAVQKHWIGFDPHGVVSDHLDGVARVGDPPLPVKEALHARGLLGPQLLVVPDGVPEDLQHADQGLVFPVVPDVAHSHHNLAHPLLRGHGNGHENEDRTENGNEHVMGLNEAIERLIEHVWLTDWDEPRPLPSYSTLMANRMHPWMRVDESRVLRMHGFEQLDVSNTSELESRL